MTATDINRFEPLFEGHPSVGDICPACQKPLEVGERPTLVSIGPGDDPQARELAREGRAYSAVCVVAHQSCVYGVEDDSDG